MAHKSGKYRTIKLGAGPKFKRVIEALPASQEVFAPVRPPLKTAHPSVGSPQTDAHLGHGGSRAVLSHSRRPLLPLIAPLFTGANLAEGPSFPDSGIAAPARSVGHTVTSDSVRRSDIERIAHDPA